MSTAREAGEIITSQWSNLRAPFNNDGRINNFPLFQARRHIGQWKPGNTAHVYRSQRQQCAMKFWFLDTDILQITQLSFYCCTVLTVVILFKAICMGFLKQKVWLKLKNNFNKKGGGCLIMPMSNDACLVGYFCVEPGFFLFRTMHLLSNRAFCIERVL